VPLVVRPHLGKTLGWLIFDAVLLYSCLGSKEWWSYVCALICLWNGLKRLLDLLPGCSRLVIGEDGLTVRSFWRDKLLPWEFLESFSPPKDFGSAIAEMIQVTFTPGAPELPFQLSRGEGGSAGHIPGFGNGAGRTAELLNRYLRQAKAARQV
jgi:hypothetical protein